VTFVSVTDVRPALESVTFQVLNQNLYFALNIPVITEKQVRPWVDFFIPCADIIWTMTKKAISSAKGTVSTPDKFTGLI